MGKKRKKSSAPPPPVEASVIITETPAPEAPVSQPSLSEAKAEEILAAAEPKVEPTPTPMIAISETTEPPALAEAAEAEAPESETPMSETPFSSDTPSVASTSDASPATARPKRKRKKRPTKPPVSREALDQKIGRLEAKLEEKKDAAAKAAREGFGSKHDEDDTSVPPVDLEVHDAFFAAGEKEHALTKESGSFAALDARHAQKMSLAAHARRAHLSRYVKWSVGAAAAILMLGFTIKTFRGHPNEEPVRKEVTHTTQVAAQPVQETAQPKADTLPPPTAVVEVDEKTDDKKDDTALAGDAKAPEVAVTETNDKKEDMPPEKPKNAWQEKQAAKAALERGSNAVAIQAGERSVALDPSDGEAWLVLGGAYQAMGNASQAKRCYNACVSQGKKGPISDCKDVLGSL